MQEGKHERHKFMLHSKSLSYTIAIGVTSFAAESGRYVKDSGNEHGALCTRFIVHKIFS